MSSAAQPARSGIGGPLLLTLLFLGAAVWLALRPQQQGAADYPPYSTVSPGKEGCLAFYELLEELHYEPRRFSQTEYHYPSNCCMVALQAADEFSVLFSGSLDVKALRLWLEEGGRLVLASSGEFDSTIRDLLEELEPDSTQLGQATAERRLLARRVRDGQPGKLTAMSRAYKPGSIFELKDTRPPLFHDVRYIETAEPDISSNLGCDAMLATYDPSFGSPQLEPLLLYRQHGAGELFVLLRPEMVTNDWISRADNHKLLLNLIDYAGRDRPLYFDEHLHGYTGQGENALGLLFHSTGGRLLLGLAALLCLFWLGQAISPARSAAQLVPPRRQSTEMVLAQADLFRRGNARHSVADALVETLRRSYMEALHLPLAPGFRELAVWARAAAAELDNRQRKSLEPLLSYLDTRLLPRSGAELASIAQGCDLLRARLEQGLG